MTFTLKATTAILIAATLAGCGGASIEEATLSKAERFDAMAARVDAMTLSGPRVVDATTGSASFTGYSGIIAGSEFNRTVLVGDAQLTVNFTGSGSVNGSITNLSGLAGVNDYVTGSGTLDDYSGKITISDGSVGSGNALDASYNGTLRGNGDTLALSGTMYGQFKGNPSIRAVELGAYDYATLNGDLTTAFIAVTAERD